jgi:hypothetical protein
MTVFSVSLGLVLNDLIVFTVEAKNIEGYGIASVANTVGVSVITTPKKPPTVPIKGANTTDLALHITWNALTLDDTG